MSSSKRDKSRSSSLGGSVSVLLESLKIKCKFGNLKNLYRDSLYCPGSDLFGVGQNFSPILRTGFSSFFILLRIFIEISDCGSGSDEVCCCFEEVYRISCWHTLRTILSSWA